MDPTTLEGLWIDDDEDEVILQNDVPNPYICLVGKFPIERSIRVSIIKERMAKIWDPLKGVSIKVLGKCLFLFEFFHHLNF